MPLDVPIIIGLKGLGKLRNSNLTFYKINRKLIYLIKYKLTDGLLP